MAKFEGASAERMADYFVEYLFKEYQGTRHVRRVASWVGIIILGIEKLAGVDWKIPRARQLWFDCAGRSFKAKYNHTAGPRGGIEIIEVLPGPGSPEGGTVFTITTLHEAGQFYRRAEKIFASYLARAASA